jgi:hypothetical protein
MYDFQFTEQNVVVEYKDCWLRRIADTISWNKIILASIK